MNVLSRMIGLAAPERTAVDPEYAIAPPDFGVLADLVGSLGVVSGDNDSGVHLLGAGVPAFAARLALIESAEHSLDVQYYLFHHDETGTLLAWSLWQAAERGVRVRLLLDDMERRVADFPLVVLDAHPNIEVRLYNPFFRRNWRALQLLTQFQRLNHRMHNKSLTADNLLTIVGGRNLGDEYFEINQHVNFGDLDVLAVGPVVTEVSRAFDGYWNADQVYPLRALRPEPQLYDSQQRQKHEHQRALQALAGRVEKLLQYQYFQTVTGRQWLERLFNNQLPLIWAPTQVWFDVPDFSVSRLSRLQARRLGISNRHTYRRYSGRKKVAIRKTGRGPADEQRLDKRLSAAVARDSVARNIIARNNTAQTNAVETNTAADIPSQPSSGQFVIEHLLALFAGAQEELFLVSPYCVTREAGTELLVGKAQQGVKVSIVTNSLAATDILAVHAGYSNYRKALLRGGVSLYEVKAAPDIQRRSWSLSSMSSLHAKTFIVDRRWVFIGSFNLDPRSAWINTETGLLIDSPQLAEDMLSETESLLEQIAYRVELDRSRLCWLDLADQRRYCREPGSRFWRRLSAGLISLLPLESQL